MRIFSSVMLCLLVASGGCRSRSPQVPTTQRVTTEARTPAVPDRVVAPARPDHRHGEQPRDEDAKITLDKLAASAVRLEGLGTYTYPVTTKSKDAQAFFDQGFRLMYAFNHDEATRSFARAAQLDPACAMCWWGASLTLGPNYNVPMLPERSEMAWQALQQARATAPDATPVEQALIGALATRYGGPEPRTPEAQQPYNEAFAEAMAEVARQFPDDVDVQVLYAEARMNLNPWRLWSLDGIPAPGTKEIVQTLETVLARVPDHPGANHYYIHAVEASTKPDRAVPSAERLGALMPAAGHTVHMPAHIFQRVGRYADASESNRQAIVADNAYMETITPWGYYPMYLSHNHGFLAFSSSMEGRRAESLEAARQSAAAMPPEMLSMMPGMDFFASLPILAMVRFGEWDGLLAEPRPDKAYVVMTALWLHGHGMAAAVQGDLETAAANHQELAAMTEEISPDILAGNNTAKDVMTVATKVLGARIAQAQKDPKTLAMWADAVEAADQLAYAEPNDWFYPVRHYHGAALLEAKQYRQAAAVYREDLARNPHNGWGLFGLAQALDGQGKKKEAKKVRAQFQKAWKNADIELTRTAF